MKTPKKILVPVDFSECSFAALEAAHSLAQRFEAEIDVLHVWEPPYHVVPDALIYVPGGQEESLRDYVKNAAREEMERFVKSFEDMTGREVNALFEWGEPTRTIAKVARDGEYDLIVMGTHGRTGFRRFLMGSVAEKVVRIAPCPVLTTPGDQGGEKVA